MTDRVSKRMGRGRKSPVPEPLPECKEETCEPEGSSEWMSEFTESGRLKLVKVVEPMAGGGDLNPCIKLEPGSEPSPTASRSPSSQTRTPESSLVSNCSLETEPGSTSTSTSFSAGNGKGELGTRSVTLITLSFSLICKNH